MATLTPNPLEWNFRNAIYRAVSTASQPPLEDNGFTEIVLSENNRAYYIDSNGGSDSNDGTFDFPFLTAKRATENAMVGGDHILFEQDGDYQGDANNMSVMPSGQAGNPTVASTYSKTGSGNRRARVRPFGWQGSTVKAHILVSGLHFYDPRGRPSDPLFDPAVHPVLKLLSASHNNIAL